MDRIWAPWRMEYIENVNKEDGCFLCDALASSDDKKNLILYRGKESFIIMNRYPYNSCHIMIAPNKHTPDILGLSAGCREEIMTLAGKSMSVMTDIIESQGFNCGMNFGRVAGAGLKDHFHFHIVPRWSGDTNFFPIFGETKSMPEYLEKSYERLIKGFKKL